MGASDTEISRFTGEHPDSRSRFEQMLPAQPSSIESDLPDSYDSRMVYPFCPTIREIRDQGTCSYCWAFAATETMSDRVSRCTNLYLS